MTALVHNGVECILLPGNPQKFSGPISAINGEQMVMVRKVPLTLQAGHSPPGEYKVFISPVPENIWSLTTYEVKLCKPLLMNSTSGLVIKPVLRENASWEAVSLPLDSGNCQTT